MKSIYADGNLRDTYRRLKHHLEQEKDIDNKPLTYSLLMEKWSTHIKMWNMAHGEKKSEYIGAKVLAERKNLYEFLGEKMYLNEFSLDKGEHKRDEYLFPSWLTITELNDLFNKIRFRIKTRKKDIIDGKIQ